MLLLLLLALLRSDTTQLQRQILISSVINRTQPARQYSRTTSQTIYVVCWHRYAQQNADETFSLPQSDENSSHLNFMFIVGILEYESCWC